MKTGKLYIAVLCVGFFLFAATNNLAAKQNWEELFQETLVKGKQDGNKVQALEAAIRNAMERNAPACQVMKTAISLDYNPYLVLTTIYAYGSIEIDELCICGTEEGIAKEIIAKAAADATRPGGDKVYTRVEVKQSQCLQPALPYTAAAADIPDPPEAPDPVPPVSASAP
jgi:hypothetical protein